MLNKFETEDISKLLVQFSLPAIAGMIIHSCYNIVSRMFVGNMGNDGHLGLAALAVVFPVMLLFFSICVLFGLGGANLYSIKLGEKKYDEAENILGMAILSGSIVTAIICIPAYFFSADLLTFFGASNDVLPYANAYFKIIALSSVIGCIGFTVNAFVRADGSPTVAMNTMIIGAVFNIVASPIFLFALKWGMTGLALATAIGQCLTMLWVLYYFCSKKANIQLNKKMFKLNLPLIFKIASMGMPPCAMQLINSFIMFFLNKSLVIYGGDMAISAMGIVMSIQTIMIMPIVGLSQGAQPIIGYNFGAGIFSRVEETVKKAIFYGTIFVLFVFLLMRFFPSQIMTLFTQNPALRELGIKCMNTWFLALPLIAIQILGSCYFQSIGKVLPSLFLTSTRQLIFLIPAIYFLPIFWKFDGLLYAAPLSDFLSTILTAIFLFKDIKKEKTRRLKLETA